MRRWLTVGAFGAVLLVVLLVPSWPGNRVDARDPRGAWGAKEGEACVACHAQQNVALVEEWRLGRHGQVGVNCHDCHRAERGDPDAFEHYGYTIAVLVTPKDCGRCHQKQ